MTADEAWDGIAGAGSLARRSTGAPTWHRARTGETRTEGSYYSSCGRVARAAGFEDPQLGQDASGVGEETPREAPQQASFDRVVLLFYFRGLTALGTFWSRLPSLPSGMGCFVTEDSHSRERSHRRGPRAASTGACLVLAGLQVLVLVAPCLRHAQAIAQRTVCHLPEVVTDVLDDHRTSLWTSRIRGCLAVVTTKCNRADVQALADHFYLEGPRERFGTRVQQRSLACPVSGQGTSRF